MTQPLPADYSDRHPATTNLLSWFEFNHLPETLWPISLPLQATAHEMVNNLEDGPELASGLRHLLEAKDCFVRQAIADGRQPKIEQTFEGSETEGVNGPTS